MDDDDKEGSRSIPSRTRIGKQAAFLKEFPQYGQPLVLFGGLVTISNWGYRNLPLAVIDIMMSDLPHVEYRKERITQQDIEDYKVKSNQIRERVKKEGLLGRLSLANAKTQNINKKT